jgi:hypothetical protein
VSRGKVGNPLSPSPVLSRPGFSERTGAPTAPPSCRPSAQGCTSHSPIFPREHPQSLTGSRGNPGVCIFLGIQQHLSADFPGTAFLKWFPRISTSPSSRRVKISRFDTKAFCISKRIKGRLPEPPSARCINNFSLSDGSRLHCSLILHPIFALRAQTCVQPRVAPYDFFKCLQISQ